jgi:hypothetical protein
MGLSHELNNKFGVEIYHEIVARRLPENLQLIPYDILLRFFEANIPNRIILLMPSKEATLSNSINKQSLQEWLNTADIITILLKDLINALIELYSRDLLEDDVDRLMFVCSKSSISTIAEIERSLQSVLPLSKNFFEEIRFEADMRIKMNTFDAVFFLLIFSKINQFSLNDLFEILNEDAARIILSVSKSIMHK